MPKKLFRLNINPSGFTLVELLVALAITAAIGSAIVMSITQLLAVSVSDKNHMEAVKQVENALHYINRDIQMARPDQIAKGENLPFPLVLVWIDPTDGNKTYKVTYSIDGNNCLQRNTEVDSDSNTITAARYIDSSNSFYTFSEGSDTVTIQIKADIGGYKPVTEIRTLQVQPRIGQ